MELQFKWILNPLLVKKNAQHFLILSIPNIPVPEYVATFDTYWLVAFFVPHDDKELVESLSGIGEVNHVASAPAHPLLGDGYVVLSGAIQQRTVGEGYFLFICP